MALFKDIIDFKRFVSDLNRNYNWDDLKGKVDMYTLMHVTPFISLAEFTPLQSRYLSDTSTAADLAILPYLQPAIAYYTYLHMLTTERVKLSQMGVTENRSDDGTVNPASGYAINDAKIEAAYTADYFMDQLLEYMEMNKADYPLWAASSAYTQIKECFVSSTQVLNRYVKATNSRRTFMAIRSELLFIQENRVKPILGETFYSTLLTEFQAGTVTANNQKVIERILPYQSKAAFLEAVPNHQIDYVDGGLQVKSFLDQTIKKTEAREEAIARLMRTFASHAEELRTNLISFLDDNANDYPDYTPTTETLSDDELSYKLGNNEHRKSFRI